MAKLYFRHGPMSASKTLNLLAVAHNYRTQGKSCVLIKAWGGDASAHCFRSKDWMISSRCGMSEKADLLVLANYKSHVRKDNDILFENVHCVLVDEAQFLDPKYIDTLRDLTVNPGIPVICYGLRTNFKRELFPGSRRLLEVADSIEEVKVTCQFCNRKAIYNMRIDAQGNAITDGESVLIQKDHYVPACHPCYMVKTGV